MARKAAGDRDRTTVDSRGMDGDGFISGHADARMAVCRL